MEKQDRHFPSVLSDSWGGVIPVPWEGLCASLSSASLWLHNLCSSLRVFFVVLLLYLGSLDSQSRCVISLQGRTILLSSFICCRQCPERFGFLLRAIYLLAWCLYRLSDGGNWNRAYFFVGKVTICPNVMLSIAVQNNTTCYIYALQPWNAW